MLFRQLFDPETSTYTYLLADLESREAVLIDPVREQIARDTRLLQDLELTLRYVLDTHVHADHVTGAGALRNAFHAQTVVSKHGGAPCADVLVGSGDQVRFGRYALEVRETPGHTDGCVTYVTSDHKMAFTGDALLIRGSGRTDFQQGDARRLYQSVHTQIFSLPDDTLLYPGHDYQGRTVTTVGEEKALNPRLGGGKSEADFVAVMESLNLPRPKKIDEAVPANLKCGIEEGPAPATAPTSPFAQVMTRASDGTPEVSAEWLRNNLQSGRLVDVREPDELVSELRKIQGVENIPLGTVERQVADWPRDAPIVVICRSGGRSGRAARAMESLGFTRVVSLAGGMQRWNQLGYPTA